MSDTSPRRHFLKTAALAPLAVGALVSPAAQAALAPPKRVGGANLKISLNAYSFAKLLNDQLLGRGAGMSLVWDTTARPNSEGSEKVG